MPVWTRIAVILARCNAASEAAVADGAGVGAVAAADPGGDSVLFRRHREAERRLAAWRADAHLAPRTGGQLPADGRVLCHEGSGVLLQLRRAVLRSVHCSHAALAANTPAGLRDDDVFPSFKLDDVQHRHLSLADDGGHVDLLSARGSPSACEQTGPAEADPAAALASRRRQARPSAAAGCETPGRLSRVPVSRPEALAIAAQDSRPLRDRFWPVHGQFRLDQAQVAARARRCRERAILQQRDFRDIGNRQSFEYALVDGSEVRTQMALHLSFGS